MRGVVGGGVFAQVTGHHKTGSIVTVLPVRRCPRMDFTVGDALLVAGAHLLHPLSLGGMSVGRALFVALPDSLTTHGKEELSSCDVPPPPGVPRR